MKVTRVAVPNVNAYSANTSSKTTSEATKSCSTQTTNMSSNNKSGLNVVLLKDIYNKLNSENLGTRPIYATEKLDSSNYNGIWFGVDTQPPLNVNSKGDNALTVEQIKSLQNKYDVTNLSPQEEYNLLQELTVAGVITKEEAMNTQIATDVIPFGVTFKENELAFTNDIKQSNMIERFEAMLHDELALYNKGETEYGEKYKDALPLIDSHKKVFDILKQLEVYVAD